MNLKQLQALIYVSREGTFKKAAEALYLNSAGDEFITPESIQYRIKQLEQELGVSLYQKRQGSARVLLTREGQLFLREAMDVYSRMSEWRNMFMENGPGRLTFATTQAVLIHRVIDAIRSFQKANENVRLQVLSASAESMEKLVMEGQVDFAISTRRPERPELEYAPWKRNRMVLVVPDGHPLGRKKKPTLTEIAQFPMIMLEQELRGDRDLVTEAFLRAGVEHINIAIETSNSEIITAYVEAGLGVGIISETATLNLRRKIQVLPVEEITERSDLGLLVREGQFMPERAKTFLLTLDGDFFGKWLADRDDRIGRQLMDSHRKDGKGR